MWKKFLDQSWLVFLAIFIFAFLWRLPNLTLPLAITHDELDYALNAKWLSLTGSDLTQTWQPWSLQPIKTQTLMAEITSVVEALFIPLIKFNLIGLRSLSVLLGALLPVALMWWLKQLNLDKKVVYIAGLIFVFNPWGLVQSHLFYEAPLALLWLLLALVSLVTLWQSKKKSLWRIILLFFSTSIFLALSFYSYHAYKFLILPIFLVQVIWLWWQNQPRRFSYKEQAKIATLAIFAILLFLYARTYFQQTQFSDRAGEVIFANSAFLQETAASERLLSLETPLNHWLDNKMTVLLRTAVGNFLQAFNPYYWFVNADTGTLFGLIDHGWFYLLDLPLIILGAYALITQKKWSSQKWLWFCLLIFSVTPAVVYSAKFTGTFRASFLIPVSLVFVAFAFDYLLTVPAKTIRYYLLTGIIFLYALSIGYWQWFYVARYPINSLGNSLFEERLLANYLRLWQQNYPDQELTVIVANPYAFLRAFIFYVESDEIDQDLVERLAQQLQQGSEGTFRWENFTFTGDKDLAKQTVIDGKPIVFQSIFELTYDLHIPDQKREILASPLDSGAWFTFIDQNNQNYLCADQALPAYVHLENQADFDLENLTREDFCSKWLMQNDYGVIKIDVQEN